MTLPITTTGVVGTPQMVFTNPIMTTHVSRIEDQPLMNSMDAGRCRNVDVMNPKRRYQKPSTITVPIFYHRNGHYVRLNKVAFKYLDFKKDVDLDAHIKVFNFVEKINTKTSKEYIINVFNYMLKNTSSNWCHNYISKFPYYIF